METPKPLTEEEKEKTKSMIASDAKLVQDGAEINDDGSLKATEDQIISAKWEMEKDKPSEIPEVPQELLDMINEINETDYRAYISEEQGERMGKILSKYLQQSIDEIQREKMLDVFMDELYKIYEGDDEGWPSIQVIILSKALVSDLPKKE